MKKLLPAEPRHVRDWVVRGLYHVELGHWDKAARDYGEAIRHGANDPGSHWQTHALLCRLAGQQDEHRRVCAQMLERFGKTDDPWTAFRALQVCQHMIEPSERDRLLVVVEKNPDLRGLRGELLYRQGKFEAAAQHLEEFLKAPKWLHCQLARLFLAMAYQRLGRGEEARALLTEVSSWVAQFAPSIPWFGARQELKMLREEAEELILGKPTPR
jgi:tetratricopeptide (TPR) repeat protein